MAVDDDDDEALVDHDDGDRVVAEDRGDGVAGAGETSRIDTAWAIKAPNGDVQLKLIATTKSVDLISLELQAPAQRGGPGGALLDIIRDAGRAERGPDAEVSAEEPWGADAVTVEIGP